MLWRGHRKLNVLENCTLPTASWAAVMRCTAQLQVASQPSTTTKAGPVGKQADLQRADKQAQQVQARAHGLPRAALCQDLSHFDRRQAQQCCCGQMHVPKVRQASSWGHIDWRLQRLHGKLPRVCGHCRRRLRLHSLQPVQQLWHLHMDLFRLVMQVRLSTLFVCCASLDRPAELQT